MDTIGIILRQKREELGLALNEAAKKTKIHINVLKALEEDRFEGISPIYVKGFLKIYSKLLGLNEKDIIGKYNALKTEQETFDFKEEKERTPGDSPWGKWDLSRIFKGGVYILVVLLALLLISKAIKFISRGPKSKKQESALQKGVIPIKKNDFLKLSVLVKEDSWVKVKVDGRTVFQNVLKRGKTETWQAKKKLELSLGNAGATELEINGKIISGLGRRGQVIKSIVITEEGLQIKD